MYYNRQSANWQGTCSGQKVVAWRAKVARAEDASSPHSIKTILPGYNDPAKVSLERMDGSGIYRKRQTCYAITREWNSVFPYILPYAPAITTQDDRALRSVKNKLTNVNDTFKGMVALGQIKETASIVRDVNAATIGLLRVLIDLKHLKFARAYRAASNAWLTYSFGVKPLISDLKQLSSTIADSLVTDHQRTAISTYGIAADTSSNTLSLGSFADVLGITYDLRRVASTKSKVVYSAGLKPYLRNSSDYGLDDQFGMTLGDVLPAVWELTPWSWALDYVANVGEMVDDLFWSPPGRTVYLCKTIVHESKCILYATPRAYPYGSSVIQSESGKHAFKYIEMNRTVLSSLPHIGARFRSFDEVAHNGLTKISYLASALYKPR